MSNKTALRVSATRTGNMQILRDSIWESMQRPINTTLATTAISVREHATETFYAIKYEK